MSTATRPENQELIDFLDRVTAGPCILVIHRMGPTANIGPFPNFDAATEYRRVVLRGVGQVIPLVPPTDPPDWKTAGSLAG